MSKNPDIIIEKLEFLTSEQLAEVDNFIDHIRVRDEGKQASNHAFQAIWDNADDSVYDAL